MNAISRSAAIVDDDEATIYLHRYALQKSGMFDEVLTYENGRTMLDNLQQRVDSGSEFPSLIFLDINMPDVNGWEFLEAYEQFPDHTRKSVIVVMVSASLNPDDHAKAKKMRSVDEFCNKPLRDSDIKEFVNKYFEVTD